jgi:hypothetical protein
MNANVVFNRSHSASFLSSPLRPCNQFLAGLVINLKSQLPLDFKNDSLPRSK